MGIVAEKVVCRCGMDMNEVFETIQWNDEQGNTLIIRNVPTLHCTRDGCREECRTARVQLNVSMIADEMRNGQVGKELNYSQRI